MQALLSRSLIILAALAGAVACDSGDGSDESAQTSGETGTDTGTETDADTETGADTDDGLITNACGTFDPNEPGDSVIPQDPDDPEILTACTALCEAQAGIMDCTTTAEACLEHCKMRSCAICPGTLAPLVDCETTMFVGDGCTCDAEGIDCPTPAACSELSDETGFCGG
jgi:hypothetical protein